MLASEPGRSDEHPKTIFGAAAVEAIKQKGERCYARYREYVLANFSKAFVWTGSDHCFYLYQQPDEAAALNQAKETCSKYKALQCDVMLVNSNFPALGISFKLNTRDAGKLSADPDLFYYGPGAATGAILWVPGRGAVLGRAVQIQAVQSPNYLREFDNNGWDVYHYYAPPEPRSFLEGLMAPDVVNTVTTAVSNLAKQGYRKVVLAGHSWGGTLALYAAPKAEQLSADISTAPGAARSDPPTEEDTSRGLSLIGVSLREMAGRQLRVAMVILDGDPFNPNADDRMYLSRGVLGIEHIPSLLIHPSGGRFTGHFATEQLDFALEYAPCLRRFVEAPTVELSASCEKPY